MSALVELIFAIVAFIIEVTFYALVFVFYLVMALFSPKYRQRLKEDWNGSVWKRISIISGVALYSAALAFALFFWTPFLATEKDPEVSEIESSEPVEEPKFTRDEIREIRETKEIGDLVKVAGDILKRKAEERENEGEQGEPLKP